jgi:hypothetical protein
VITPRAALLIFSPFLLRLKLFDVTARDVIRIIQQKISDAEEAGVREVPLLNLRRLIDQIEQDILGDHAKTPHRTQSGSSRSKLNTGIMNKTQKILTVAARVVFIAFGAFLSKGEGFLPPDPNSWGSYMGNFRSGPRINVRRNNAVVHARRDLHRVVFLAAK